MANNGTRILAKGQERSNDTWVTGINNNDLIIGPSGAGKTRNYVKPNLLQCDHSVIVADTKGSLVREIGPVLRQHGYRVLNIDFTDLLHSPNGYNPFDYIRYDPVLDKYSEQDILQVSACLIPDERSHDPFWERAAQLYLSSLIAYVLEALPAEEHHLMTVSRLYELLEDPNFPKLFEELEEENPHSYAARVYKMASGNKEADKTYASIKMFLVNAIAPLTFDGMAHLYLHEERIRFEEFGKEKIALFLTISDTDRSMDKLANLFYTQALQTLCESADKDYINTAQPSRLPVPVRFILDDFATNVKIPDFDKIISVIRSREIYVSLIIQSINQLYSLYGPDPGKTIINNCDNCLYLGGQDVDTADFISIKANRSPNTILNMPLGDVWLFTRGRQPMQVEKYDLKEHPRYPETAEGGGNPPPLFSAQGTGQPEPPAADSSAADGARPEASPAAPAHEDQPDTPEAGRKPPADEAGMPELPLPGSLALPDLLDENGEYSEHKALVAAHVLTTRLSLEEKRRHPYLLSGPGRAPQKTLGPKEEECLTNFFYCALRLSASRPFWIPELQGSLQDLMQCANRMEYTRKHELVFRELAPVAPEAEGNFFLWMDEVFELLCGVPITRMIGTIDRRIMEEQHREELSAMGAEYEPYAFAFPDDFEDIDFMNTGISPARELEEFECAQQAEDETAVFQAWRSSDAQREKLAWAAAFPQPVPFCRSYLAFREQYFTGDLPQRLPQLVKQALELYATENPRPSV